MIVGIIAAKANSNRFANKNRHILDGEPMFWHSVKPLLAAKLVDKVVVATDSDYIRDYCEERDVQVVWRNRNASVDDDPLLTVLRYAYYHLDEEYDIVATIMANCPGHSPDTIDRAIDKMRAGGFREMRSFNVEGEESGFMLFKSDVIRKNAEISSHIGRVDSDVKEIHRREDLDARNS